MMGTGLSGHAAGDLAHRCEQRQQAVGELDRLIGDGGGSRGDEAPGLIGVGGEVKIREDDVSRLEKLDLGRLRLLDLDDQVGFGKQVAGVGDDLSADTAVVVVLDG